MGPPYFHGWIYHKKHAFVLDRSLEQKQTICRVQSQWKHYLEFGNTFAFKPIFNIENNEDLIEISNPMKGLKDFKESSAVRTFWRED